MILLAHLDELSIYYVTNYFCPLADRQTQTQYSQFANGLCPYMYTYMYGHRPLAYMYGHRPLANCPYMYTGIHVTISQL